MSVTISGGTKWQAYLERLAQKVQVRAGVMEGATNDAHEPIAPYAAYNEFGTARIPARPFMRNTLERERENWIRDVGDALANGLALEATLKLVGERMAEAIQTTIKSNLPHAPAAVAQRAEAGRAKTLVDTGALLNSITHQVAK